MSKERLEEIEKNLDPLGYGMGGHLISVNDINWLVGYAKEQAERVQELERDKEELYKLNQRASEDAMVRYKSLLSHTIEQAERLQELRKRYLTLTKENNQINDELIDEFRKNKRYREALEFYADEETYESSEVQIGAVTKEGYKISKYKFVPIINTDKGEKARKALEGEE